MQLCGQLVVVVVVAAAHSTLQAAKLAIYQTDTVHTGGQWKLSHTIHSFCFKNVPITTPVIFASCKLLSDNSFGPQMD